MKVSFYTLGCKVNQYESRAMTEALEAEGVTVVPFGVPADAVIINTCAVTVEAERKGRQIIHRAVRENPGAFIAVTGCSAQLSGKTLASLPGVSLVVGNAAKMAVVEAVLAVFAALPAAKTASAPPDRVNRVVSLTGAPFEPMRISASERTRAYIKIEDGCASRCAYCAIRFARGEVRSKPPADVFAEAERLLAAGYRELVLVGIEISAYGKDIGCDLASLLALLDKIDVPFRLRLGSLDPALLKPAWIRRIAPLPHLAPHFHLSLQSGCDKTLAAMRRMSNTAMIRESVELLRALLPDATFTADVIVGFPGETDEDFEVSKAFIASLGLLDFHIFSFSPRPGTEAASMPDQVPGTVKARREKELAALREASTAALLSAWVGRAAPVLFESFLPGSPPPGNAPAPASCPLSGRAIGHTANFMEVIVPAARPLDNRLLPVRFTAFADGRLEGKIVEEE